MCSPQLCRVYSFFHVAAEGTPTLLDPEAILLGIGQLTRRSLLRHRQGIDRPDYGQRVSLQLHDTLSALQASKSRHTIIVSGHQSPVGEERRREDASIGHLRRGNDLPGLSVPDADAMYTSDQQSRRVGVEGVDRELADEITGLDVPELRRGQFRLTIGNTATGIAAAGLRSVRVNIR